MPGRFLTALPAPGGRAGGLPLAGAAILVLIGVAGALHFARNYVNAGAEEGERRQLAARLAELATAQAARIVEFRGAADAAGALDGAADPAQRAILAANPASRDFDAVFLLEGGRVGREIARREPASARDDRERAAIARLAAGLDGEDLRGTENPRGAADASPSRLAAGQSWFTRAGEDALVVSFAAIPASPPDRALAGVYRLTGDRLAGLGSGARLAPLAPGEAGAAALELPRSSATDGPVVLSWRPDRPGDRLAASLAPLIVGLAALFAAFIAFVARSTTRELLARERAAREAGGRDFLCGLPNRAVFYEFIDAETASASPRPFAILYVDLDRFKEINDSFGHDCGDQAILAATRSLTALLGPRDVCSRLGGDEFAILRRDLRDPGEGEELARRIVEAMRAPLDLFGQSVHCGVSIGLALYPRDGGDREALLRAADIALYRAKSEGRGRYALFDTHMADERRARKQTEIELRRALENSELAVHYQPIVAPDGKKIVGAEALVRWNHPRRGMVGPGEFIQIAEDRGLIGPLGEFVLRRACSDALRWRDIHVAVNVSPVQFRQKNFVGKVQRALGTTGLDPARLEIEITESAIITEESQAEDAMIELRAMGARLALDDFGTGYSSLIYLRRFAFDKIKIDRSFLEAMESTGESAIIVHSVVHLGRALGLTVTAEGIETAEQHRFLQAVGCHEMQGYYFARPLPREEFEKLLARQNGLVPQVSAA